MTSYLCGMRLRRSALFGLALLFATGCSRSPAPTGTSSAEPAPIAVEVVSPEKRAMTQTLEQPAYLEAFEETPLVTKVAGFVDKVNADIGDVVRKGAPLIELSVPELDAEGKQKDAAVLQAEAECKLARDQVAVTEAEVKRLQSQLDRLAKMGKGGIIDKETIEETQHALEASKARRDMAQSDVDVKAARVDVTKGQREYVQAMIGYTKIRAPFDGVVVRRNVHTGHFLQPAVSNSQPALVIARMDTLRAFIDVPESDAPWIKLGLKATVRIAAIKEDDFSGTVGRTAWSLEPRTRTLRAEIDLANPDGKLRPGMYATVKIQNPCPDCWTLPVSAVAGQGEDTFAFQVIDDKLVRTPLRIGIREARFVQILRMKAKPATGEDKEVWAPLAGTEKFVKQIVPTLKGGQAVTIVTPAAK